MEMFSMCHQPIGGTLLWLNPWAFLCLLFSLFNTFLGDAIMNCVSLKSKLHIWPNLCNYNVNMSIAILPMSAEFNWSPATVGLVQSSFFWGYLLTQTISELLPDRMGCPIIFDLEKMSYVALFFTLLFLKYLKDWRTMK
eukprot:Gb_01308 [translate_table: standard]